MQERSYDFFRDILRYLKINFLFDLSFSINGEALKVDIGPRYKN